MNIKRHEDDDIFDDVRIRLVPRYKTSGLSGDEWRVSAILEMRRKGTVIYTRGYRNVETAAAHLPWLLQTVLELGDDEIPEWIKQIKRDESLCCQPSCASPATARYRLKKEFSREGFEGVVSDTGGGVFRQFCDEHKTRGDCGLEDADRNYDLVFPLGGAR